MATGQNDRLDGWKAIGAHFGRDRTTVMRWAQDRQMPVHAVPGGKTRTVFALREQLDRWATDQATANEPGDAIPASRPTQDAIQRATTRGGSPLWRRRMLALGALGAALVAGGALSARWLQPSPILPSDPATATLFVQAREDWAKRTAPSLARAIREFGVVTHRSPNFAPAYAYLADAYLLETENGELGDDAAFGRARESAEHALALDPDLAAAHRALGFIAYWERHDRTEARLRFDRALALDPNDGQTHFWLANILADSGEDARAAQEFDRARILLPGAPAIAADYAWAQWIAGRDADADALLTSIIKAHPDNAEAYDSLSMMRLGRGDVAGYLAAAETRAALRGKALLAEQIGALKRAMAAGGAAAVERQLVADEDRRQNEERYPDHSTAAWIASVAGDRATLVRILTEADARSESWGSAGYVRRIAERWRSDGAVLSLLKTRVAS